MGSEVRLCSELAGANPLPHAVWDLELKQEIATLGSCDGVLADSIQVYGFEKDKTMTHVVVSFSIERGDPAKTLDPRIQTIEPMALLYTLAGMGSDAPSIYSERTDFPRDLPHLNPVEATTPSSPCVAREGNQAVYDHGGIPAIIKRLVNWLTDAAGGKLQHDGWEPLPLVGDRTLCVNGQYLQEYGYQHGQHQACRTQGVGQLVFAQRAGECVNLYMDAHNYSLSNKELMKHINRREDLTGQADDVIEERFDIPWYFIAGPAKSPNDNRITDQWVNRDDIFRFARNAQCEEVLQDIFDQKLPSLHSSMRFGVCIIIGTWRPIPLIPDIPGLAEGGARHCELTACYVRFKPDTYDIEFIWSLRMVAKPTRELMAKTSGLPRPPSPSALIGCGALGSKIGEFLVREGIEYLALVDPDTLAPHNLARHSLGAESLGLSKATEMKRDLERISGQNQELNCRSRRVRISDRDSVSLSKTIGKKPEWIIDCSADTRFSRYLARSRQPRPVIRAELAAGGTLGLLTVEGKNRSPRIDDLQAILYQMAIDYPEISAWLRDDSKLPAMMIGTGCTSATMYLGDSQIAIHAGAFMPTVNTLLTSGQHVGGVGVNRLDPDGRPLGMTWIEVPAFKKLNVDVVGETSDQWQLRMYPDILEKVHVSRNESHPAEAGGYLYGRVDVSLRTFTVVEAVTLKPLAASASGLKLPPAGQSSEERALIERCGGTLQNLGSWHSHPQGSAEWSDVDRDQAKAFARGNIDTPQPTAMMIVSSSEERAYLILPDNF